LAQAKATRSADEGELLRLRERRKEAYIELEKRRALLSRKERELAELAGEIAALGEVVEPPGGPEPGSAEVLQARLRQAERRLAELGPVNLRAIEDYDAFLKEFQLWKERVQTLEREKGEIERFLGEIEQKKREKFFATMQAVSQEFQSIFRGLFGGGEAGLSLAEEGNITSGLLVHARPPGKEPRLLDSLSGGEKTLTAIAFSLALGVGRPAPFYLLDEVDAALDQANSERLAHLLRELAKKVQVIVISHNEEIVRHADRVYGVTMRDGASEVVGMELAQPVEVRR
jgi:chromosome segregation protein